MEKHSVPCSGLGARIGLHPRELRGGGVGVKPVEWREPRKHRKKRGGGGGRSMGLKACRGKGQSAQIRFVLFGTGTGKGLQVVVFGGQHNETVSICLAPAYVDTPLPCLSCRECCQVCTTRAARILTCPLLVCLLNNGGRLQLSCVSFEHLSRAAPVSGVASGNSCGGAAGNF